MGIVNKRNAVLGWAVWSLGKRRARKKASGAVPSVEGGRPNRPAALLAGLGALGGALLFWKKKRGGGGGEEAA